MVFADTPLPDRPEPDIEAQSPANTPAIIVVADVPNPYILSYAVEIERAEADLDSAWYTISLTKQAHGVGMNNLTDSRPIGTYQVYEGGDDLATSTAHELYHLKNEVETLTGSNIEGARAMVSMAHRIGLDNGMIDKNEPFFADERLPADPFQIEPPEQLLQRYQTLEMDTPPSEIGF